MYTWIWIPIAAGVFVIALVVLRRLLSIRRSGVTRRVRGSSPEHVGREGARQGARGAYPRWLPAEKTLRSVMKAKRALPKEVELAWEASEIIDIQPGAYARTGKEPAPWEKPGASSETSIPEQAMISDVRVGAGAEGTSGAQAGAGGKRQGTSQPPSVPQALPVPSGELKPGDRLGQEERYQLPSRYGVDRLVLLARDPYWLYAYWEITHQKYAEMRDRHLREWDLSRPLLRLSDITPGVPQEQRYLDIYITDEADNWYIHVGRPRHTLFAEIGRLLPHSVFVPLVRSNVVTLPPDSVSGEISEEWAPVEWPGRYPRYRREIGLSSPWFWGHRT